jgi:two-component system, LytTR family, sensor kinase
MHASLLKTQNYGTAILICEPLFTAAIIIILCYAQSNLLAFYTPSQSRQIFIILWAIILAIILVASTYGIMFIYFKTQSAYLLFYKQTILLRLFISWVFIGAVGFYNLLWQTQQHVLKMQLRDETITSISKEAELHKLRQQIQPHFLFNSLNSINALIGSQPAEARNMVQKLSEFLRATLKKEENELIKLSDELNYIHLYLDIEKVRFGSRLQTNFAFDENTMYSLLPNLILQPIIENAIKFGLYNTLEQVTINISSKINDVFLEIEITNPISEDSLETNASTGFGLKSIQRRLQIIYNQNNLLQTKIANNIFVTTLKIPI